MAFIIDDRYSYVASADAQESGVELPALIGVEAGDLLMLLWGCKDDNVISIDGAGWIEVPNTNPSLAYLEVRAYYKFATNDDEQCSPYTVSAAQDTYMHTLCIRGVDPTVPFVDSGSSGFSSAANTQLVYPALTATADNQLAIYLSLSDGDDITAATHAGVRKMYHASDSIMYQRVVTSGPVPAFEDAVDSDQTCALGFIFNDDNANTVLPLDIQPINALSVLIPDIRNDAGWREAVYASGYDILTGAPRVTQTPILSVYGAANQWRFRVDQAASLSSLSGGELITFASGSTALFGSYDQQDTLSGGRGSLVVYNYTGTGEADNSVCTFTGGSAQMWSTGSNYQMDITGWIKSSEKITDYASVKIDGASALGISDGVYFVKDHDVLDSAAETYWYKFYSDAKQFSFGTVQVPTVGSVVANVHPYNMIEVDIPYVAGTENRYWYEDNSSSQKAWSTNIVGTTMSYTVPKDYMNKKLALWVRNYNNNGKYIYCLAIDAANEWKLWRIHSKYADDYQGAVPEYKYIDIASIDTPLRSSGGVFDVTQVKYIGIPFQASSNTSRYPAFTYDQYEVVTQTVYGGGESKKVTWSDIEKMVNAELNLFGTQFKETVQSIVGSQYVLSRDIKFSCALDMTNQALSFPPQADGAQVFLFNVDAGVVGIETDTASGVVNTSLVSSDKGAYITHTTDDTIDYTGTIFSAYTPTLQSGKEYRQVSFIACQQITGGAELVNCTVSKHTGNGAILFDGLVSGGNYTDNSYAIEIDTAGDYTLNGCTFSGNTKDINVTASSGTVTIITDVIGLTYQSAGATVVIVAPLTNYTLALPFIIDGSRVCVRNVTRSTILSNEIVAGGGFSAQYVKDSGYDAADVGIYVVTYQSGTIAKETIVGSFLFPSETSINSIPVTQEDQEQYNAYGVDGSTVDEFVWDNSNLEVDVNDADNSTYIQRIGAWYYYWITTAQGIMETTGALTWVSLNDILVHAVLDMTIDNKKVEPLLIAGGRLHRDDEQTVIAALSNSIQMDYDPVYVTATGGSALTTAENAALMNMVDNIMGYTGP